MKWAVDNGQRDVHIRADSELLVKQMRGEYKIKNPGLQPLAARARLLMMELGKVTFEHVRRELNKEADRLSNLGMDEAEKSSPACSATASTFQRRPRSGAESLRSSAPLSRPCTRYEWNVLACVFVHSSAT